MKVLFCGDIVGRSGRAVIQQYIPDLRKKLQLDLVIANGENAAHGFGITQSICQDLYSYGVDIITTGNHVFDQKEIIKTIDQDHRLLRPLNYPIGTPGRGFTFFTLPNQRQILIINAIARLFMDLVDDPFRYVDDLLKKFPLGGQTAAIILDFHGEATSEKMAMAHFCDGRVSFIVGTHSHVPTADAQILQKGSAYQTDAGMCGDYNSVIGMQSHTPIHRFIKKTPTERMSPAQGPGTFCGVFVDIHDKTGLAQLINPIRLGSHLQETTFFRNL